MKITVYDSAGLDRASLGAWRVMVRELIDARELIARLVSRNLSGQFRQSFLGYIWVILPPVATAVVFAMLRTANVIHVKMDAGAMPYALFALLGSTLWGLFSQLTAQATGSIANAGSLVSKIYFPREVLVLSAVGNGLVSFLIRMTVVIASFVLFGYAPHWQAVFLPLILLPLIALSIGLGFFLAPLNTMMSDTSRLLDFVFQFGMFLAPTVYPTPAPTGGTQSLVYWIHTLNPVAHFMNAANSLIETGTLGPTGGLFCATVASFLVLLAGWRFFHVCEPLLAERL